MKQRSTFNVLATLFSSAFIVIGCQKTDLAGEQAAKVAAETISSTRNARANNQSSSSVVNLTAPSVVEVNEIFTINANIDCGRVLLEQGYILDENFNKIYNNISCQTANLQWEIVMDYQCYTTDLSWSGSMPETGTYVFRTRHSATDANCDGLGGSNTTGNCGFTGNQENCFVINVVEPCITSFTGEAVICSFNRQIVLHFNTTNDENYIKIEGELNNCTATNATISVSGANLMSTQTAAASVTNQMIKLEGPVTACQPVTITINWMSTVTGGNSTSAWTVKNAGGAELAQALPGLKCSDE